MTTTTKEPKASPIPKEAMDQVYADLRKTGERDRYTMRQVLYACSNCGETDAPALFPDERIPSALHCGRCYNGRGLRDTMQKQDEKLIDLREHSFRIPSTPPLEPAA